MIKKLYCQKEWHSYQNYIYSHMFTTKSLTLQKNPKEAATKNKVIGMHVELFPESLMFQNNKTWEFLGANSAN